MSTDQAVTAAVPRRIPRGLRGRRIAIRVLYSLLSLYALVMAQGIVLLLAGEAITGWSFMFAASSVFKLLTLAATLPLAWTAGRRIGAARWLALGIVTWLVAEALTGQLRPLEGVSMVLFWLGPWLLLAPERRQLFLRPDRPPLPLAAATLVGVVALVTWAVQAGHAIPTAFPPVATGPDGLATLQLDLAGIPLSLAAVTVLAATTLTRSAVAVRVAGVACLPVGAAGLAWQHDLGSPGAVGGAALLLGGCALLAWSLRR